MENLRVSTAQHVCEVEISRPQTKNSFSTEMYAGFSEVLRKADADDEVRVLLVHGAEGNFSSGNDLKDFAQNPPTTSDSGPFEFLQALAVFRKPMIAAVDGFAVGIGATMLLHCDLVYATERAKFVLPFVNLALVPEAGSTLLLPQRAGHRLASELLLFGEPFDTRTAIQAGLVNRVVPGDELLAFVRKRAAQLAAKPPAAVRETKALLKSHDAESLDRCIRVEAETFLRLLAEPHAQEAIHAFLEKRKPDFE